MTPFLFPLRRSLFGVLLLVALVGLAMPTSAQVLESELDITAEEFSGLAMPMGAPATTNITVHYKCGGLTGEPTITATVDENVTGATAAIDPKVVTPEEPPTCNPGDEKTSKHTLTVTAGTDTPAGAEILVKIEVKGENVLTDPQSDTNEVSATAGPYVDVSFTPKTTEYEVPAGESAKVVIEITTGSNVMVMTMPTVVSLPEGWQKPDLFPLNIESPLVAGNGSSAMEFDVLVPPRTEVGEHVVEIEVFAHSTGDVYVPTEPETFALTFTVTPGATTTGDGAEESPVLTPVPLVVLAAVALALLRRRG